MFLLWEKSPKTQTIRTIWFSTLAKMWFTIFSFFQKYFQKISFWPNLTKFDQIWQNTWFGQIWSNFVKFGQNLSKLIKMNLNCILKFFPEIFWKFVEILGEITQVTFFCLLSRLAVQESTGIWFWSFWHGLILAQDKYPYPRPQILTQALTKGLASRHHAT